MIQQQGALTEIIQQQGRKHQSKPGLPNGVSSKMSHVGIEGFTASDTQHHRPKHHQSVKVVFRKETPGVNRVDSRKNMRVLKNCPDTQGG